MTEGLGLRSYLTAAEAAEVLGCSPKTVLRRVADGRLAALQLAPGLIRIEARAVSQRAAAALPDSPARVSVQWLADLWQVAPNTVVKLAATAGLPLVRHGRHWSLSRRHLVTWVVDHTTGDDE